MFCIKCGAKLSEGQTICPICNTRVYHPDFNITERSTYPKDNFEPEEFNRRGLMFVITILCLVPFLLPIILELSWYQSIIWSGYVSGGTLLFYVSVLLPCWFRHPNPVIFVPTSFAASALYLLYICYQTGGNWFFTFAMPLVLSMGAMVTAVVALHHYVRRGHLYIFGGFFMAFGIWCLVLEMLIRLSFGVHTVFVWSVAPLTVFMILGILLILIAIVKPFRESLKRVSYVGKV